MNPPNYIHLTSNELDAEYNNTKKTTGFNFKAFQNALDCACVEAREQFSSFAQLDIHYGDGINETLDTFINTPDGDTVIFFHGGYWRKLDKKNYSYIAFGLIPNNINLIVVNYPLLPIVRMNTLLDSCIRAVRWIFDNISSLSIAPDRLLLAGHSAGAHIVAMLLSQVYPYRFAGAVGLSGIYDLEPIRHTYLNDTLDLTKEEVELFSPVHILPRGAVRFRGITGTSEGIEYRQQLYRYTSHRLAKEEPAELLILDDVNHFNIREALIRPDSLITRLMTFRDGI